MKRAGTPVSALFWHVGYGRQETEFLKGPTPDGVEVRQPGASARAEGCVRFAQGAGMAVRWPLYFPAGQSHSER